MAMDGITKNMRFLDITPEIKRPAVTKETEAAPVTNFRDIFGNTLHKQVHFSKHAALRLNDRSITLTGDQMDRVEDAIVKANEKGIKDSLVLVDNMALIVNVKSRTVITAMNQNNNHVFSNIDGAVIV
jgi:flagellar operon protein